MGMGGEDTVGPDDIPDAGPSHYLYPGSDRLNG